jgi:mycothiol system anti-sigma-R factor
VSEPVPHSHDGLDVGADPSAQDCADYLERIVYFLDNELDDADCAAVRVHLDTCNPCLVRYDLQRTVKQVVARSCSEVAPTELRERVRLQIREVQVRITEA